MKPEDFATEEIYKLLDKYSPEYEKKLSELKEKMEKLEVVLSDNENIVKVTVKNSINPVKDIVFSDIVENLMAEYIGPLVMDVMTRALKLLDEELSKLHLEFKEWEKSYLAPITKELVDTLSPPSQDIDIVANSKKLN
jgi:hypothetical protein